MKCDIVKDLIPLYIDECCSPESAKEVREHLAVCAECRMFYETMIMPTETTVAPVLQKKLRCVKQWSASILQSVLLFLSFGMITIGVSLEASSAGFTNGLWAMWLVVPATGFMLSLANWYFIKLYKSRKSFSNCSWLLTLGITVCAYIWTCFHYEISLSMLPFDDGLLDVLAVIVFLFGRGMGVTVVFCVVSKVLSNLYGKMLGKE